MLPKKLVAKLTIIILAAILLAFFDLPAEYQKKILPNAPEFLTKQKINLGLDLQGGTQLDYKIDMRKVPSKDQEGILDGVKEVINRRVNSLGVAEPNIYSSVLGDEHHIIVELAGIKDIEEAKKTVGKTIQLEFKEMKMELDPDEDTKIRTQAKAVFDKILKEKDKFDVIAEEEQLANAGKVFLITTTEGYFKNDKGTAYTIPDDLFSIEPNSVIPKLIEITKNDSEYAKTQQTGLAVYKLLSKEEAEREINEPREVSVKHILISYQGADRADKEIKRTQEEAKKLAEELREKIIKGENFEDLAKQNSDDASNKEEGGTLPAPVIDGVQTYITEFSKAALALIKADEISPVTKTSFGYHILKALKIKEKVSEKRKEPKVKFSRLLFSTVPDQWKPTELTGEFFKRADVQFTDAYVPYVSISFNDKGAQLFQELTKKNIQKPLAIFVGGDLISAPTVQEEISGGNATITGEFTLDEAKELARDLNTGAIPAPIVLSGQMTIGATLGADALQKSLKAGLIGIIILAIGMIAYYGWAGLMAVFALMLYALMMLFFIKVQLPYSWALVISLTIFSIIVGKILKSSDPGWEKFVSFLLACFILFFISFLFANPLVQTLAGIAATILSIGMAVDANILIFERIREELRAGKPINQAVELGFDRAWSSIRDSNFSTLITCGILIYFGSSVVKGFAFNLATGVLISMFSAITITKFFLESSLFCKFVENHKLFIGLRKKTAPPALPIVQKYKLWFSLSGLLLALGIISIPLFGINYGLDFKGGSIFELKFDQKVTAEQIKNSFTDIEKELTGEQPKTSVIPKAIAQSQTEEKKAETIEFGNVVVLPTGSDSFQIKLKSISEQTYSEITSRLKQKLGKYEEKRFTTIGPTIGKTLKKQALTALVIAIVMMILYIVFAFRKIPKAINPWRFGVTAIITLIHDVSITTGFYIFLGKFFEAEIDTLFITAILTVIGYSVNDTIIIYDRIRENLKFQKRGETFEDITNRSLNETLARSINTTLSTLITIIALFIFGAISIKYFVLALILGIFLGAYSSICFASPILVLWNKMKSKASP